MASGRSYVSAINPSPFDVIAWKIERNRMASHPSFNLERMPDIPAPFPPKRPSNTSDTSHYSNVDELYEPPRSSSSIANYYLNYEV